MALTGVPLIALTVLATAAAIAVTTLFWGRFGRWRPVTRSAGVLLCEALIVLSAGLIANRHEQFYPSWQALAGTGTKTTTAVQPAGRLDADFGPGTTTVVWRPTGSAAWRLASNAQVTVPHDYVGSQRSFAALVALGGKPAGGDLVRVIALPTSKTTPGALANLPSLLGADVRVTGHGWALVSSTADASLAARLIEADRGRFAALALVGGPPPGFRWPPEVALAVARPASARGKLPRGVTPLTGTWAAAAGWAAARTPLPLGAPQVLPTGAI